MATAFLEVKNLYKTFGKTDVLNGVSFELNKGEVLSVIGSSVNGKTTLLRCLNFLETPDEGEITVNGKRVFPFEKTVGKKDKKNTLTFGLVFQNFNLFPQYSVLDNVTLAMNVYSENQLKANGVKFFERKKKMRSIKEENKTEALKLIERVGLLD
ncbi:MAG: amino acid ABC transporter ATP-binding protein, partial [Clostridia bacterium]|nr:amino acid ABC transporter ATP-binding protein [Clostridia bacterium]